jgi:ParB-like chromosome segregation protein Spo0J
LDTQSLQIRRATLGELHLDQSNARLHGERNLEAIRASLARFGQAEPLVVQKGTGRVVGGNGRLVAMKTLGWTHADVVELELTDTQATALGIALNVRVRPFHAGVVRAAALLVGQLVSSLTTGVPEPAPRPSPKG